MSKPIYSKALIYCRVSSERQKNEGHGLESQEHRCREFAKSKGYEVEEVFKDTASGGGDFMKRPQMVELLRYLDKHDHRNYVVIFDDLSRFSRDVGFHIRLKSEFKRRDAKVECVNMSLEDTPEGEMVEIMMAAQNQYHRKNNARQVKQRMKARVEKGYWSFYPPPGYGYVKDPIHGKLLVPHEPNASLIREAFEGFASDRFGTLTEVTNFLRSSNYRAGAKDKIVYIEGVKRILRRVVYAGYIERPEWDVPRRKAQHEAIVSLETFEKVQAKLDGKLTVRTRRDDKVEFALRGFLLCPFCGDTLTASWSRNRTGEKYRYYRCKMPGCERYNKSTNGNFVDQEFEKLLLSTCPNNSSIQLAKSVLLDLWEKRVDTLEIQQKQIEKQLENIRLRVDILSNRIVKATDESIVSFYEEEIKKSRGEALLLQEHLKQIGSDAVSFETALEVVMTFLKNPISIWRNEDINAKRLVLKLVFAEKLVFHPKFGFETAQKSRFLALFERISDKKSQDVEVGGIEPPSESDIESESTTRSPDLGVLEGCEESGRNHSFHIPYLDPCSGGQGIHLIGDSAQAGHYEN